MADAQTRALARRIANLEDWRRKSKTPTLGHSTIVGGALQISDLEDLLTMILGRQFDGTNAPTVVTGPPPPTPTVPGITPMLGGLSIYWDGTFEGGAVAPMDFSRVTIHAAPLAGFTSFDPTNQAQIYGEFHSATGSETIIALPLYEEYAVALYAWTIAGKHSLLASAVALGTPRQIEIPDVDAIITDAINDAQDTADAALTSANGKNKVYYQAAKPTGGVYIAGDTWFDTDDGYKLYEYKLTPTPDFYPTQFGNSALADSAITAAKIQDGVITAAELADAVNQAIEDAQTTANSALTSANGKNRVYYQATKPTGGTYVAGDTWFDTDDGYKIYEYRLTPSPDFYATQFGNSAISDSAVTAAKIAAGAVGTSQLAAAVNAAISNAQTAADDAADVANAAQLAATDAQTTADGKNKVTYGTSAPTASTPGIPGDIFWVRSGNTITGQYLCTAGTGEATGNTWAAQTLTNATIATLDAGKVTTGTLSADRIAAGSITAAKMVAGTITAASAIIADAAIGSAQIIDASIGNAEIADASITNAKIQDATIQSAKIAALDAGKITTGSLDAARIAAKSITVDKLLVSATENIVPDPGFAAPLGTAWENVATFSIAPTAGRDGGNALQSAHVTGTSRLICVRLPTATEGLPVVASGSYRIGYWAKADVAGVVRPALKWKDTAGTWTSVSLSADTVTLVAGVWTWVSGIWTAPADAVAWLPGIWINSTGPTGTYTFDDPSATRAANSSLIVDGSVTAAKMVAGTITAASGIIADAAIGSAQIIDGSIGTAEIGDASITNAKIQDATIQSAKIVALDAGKITTGFLDAARIQARTLTADKVLITGTENMIPDPGFAAALGVTWQSLANWSIAATGRDGGNALAIAHTNGTIDTNYVYTTDNTFLPCVPDGSYRILSWVKGSVAGSNAAAVLVRYKNTAGTWTVVQSPTIALAAADTWTLISWLWTAPTDAVGFRPGVRVPSAAATGTYTFDEPSVVRAANSELIVDGSVSATKMVAGTITAASGIIANAAIGNAQIADAAITTAKIGDAQITNAKISNLDAGKITTGLLDAARIDAGAITAVKLASDAIDGKTITGATLRTDSAGNRIVIRDDGTAGIIEFFGPDGEAGSMNPSSSTIEFRSPRSAAAVAAGYDPAYMYLGGQTGTNIPPRADLLLSTSERYGNGSVGGDVNAYGELRARQRLFVYQRDTHIRNRATDMNLATDTTWRTVAWSLDLNTTTVDPNEEIVYSAGEFFVFTNRTYLVTMFINFSGASTAGKRGVRIMASPTGSAYTNLGGQFVDAASSGQTHLTVTALVDQGYGLIKPEVYQDSGSTIQVMTGSRVEVRRLF